MANMPTLDDAFSTLYAALGEHFGQPQSGFLDLDPFEAMLAVVLTRASGGARVQQALEGLETAGLLTPQRLAEADAIAIGDALRAAGFSASARNVAPLRRVAQWLVNRHGGQVEELLDSRRSTDSIRAELAAISGIGPAGADAIVLLALRRPSYPVDRATFRVLVRHGWLGPEEGYEEARELLLDRATAAAAACDPEATRLLERLALGMERLGSRYCRAGAPRCDGCPLERLLPDEGPRALDD
jgi:endonuclease-3 related protein